MDEIKITKMACARIPTDAGEFQLCLYRSDHDQKEHLALIRGEVRGGEQILARVHSECFTGDVLASRRCDCGEQLQRAILSIAQAEAGVLIYLRQEGRGIGLLDKLRAYNLQDQGFDTAEANLVLGHQPDERDYSVAAGILKDLGVASIRLLTNNPDKISRLEELGVAITGRVPLETTVNADNAHYLFTKAIRMNHLLNLETIPAAVDTRKNGTH